MRTSIVRKRRTREHIIADLSVNHIERQVLLCGHTVERIFHDYGYDLFLFTFSANGEPEAGDIRVQVKASDKLVRIGKKDGLPFRLDRSHLIHWLDVKSYFRQLAGFNLFAAGQTITVYVPHANVFDPGAVRRLADIKNQERGVRDESV